MGLTAGTNFASVGVNYTIVLIVQENFRINNRTVLNDPYVARDRILQLFNISITSKAFDKELRASGLTGYTTIPTSRRIAAPLSEYRPMLIEVLHNTIAPSVTPTHTPTIAPSKSAAELAVDQLAATTGLSTSAVTAIAVVFSLLGVGLIFGGVWYMNRKRLKRTSEKLRDFCLCRRGDDSDDEDESDDDSGDDKDKDKKKSGKDKDKDGKDKGKDKDKGKKKGKDDDSDDETSDDSESESEEKGILSRWFGGGKKKTKKTDDDSDSDSDDSDDGKKGKGKDGKGGKSGKQDATRGAKGTKKDDSDSDSDSDDGKKSKAPAKRGWFGWARTQQADSDDCCSARSTHACSRHRRHRRTQG